MAWTSGFQLRVVQGAQDGLVTPLDQQVFVLGRASSPGEKASGYIFYREPTVSRVHAEMRWNEKKKLFILHHKSNTNPTLLEGTPVDKKSPRQINPGERIQMGLLVLTLEPLQARSSGKIDREDPKSGRLGDRVQTPAKGPSDLVDSVLAALQQVGTDQQTPTTRVKPPPNPGPPPAPPPPSNNGISFNVEEPAKPQAPPPVSPPPESEPSAFLERPFGNPQNTPMGFHLYVAQGPDSKQVFPIADHLLVIGRAQGLNDPRQGMGVLLNDDTLSQEAAMLVWQSREGTYGIVEAEGNRGPIRVRRIVNGVPREYGLDQVRPLMLGEGDVILLGRTALILRKGDVQAAKPVAAPHTVVVKQPFAPPPRSGPIDPSEVPTKMGGMAPRAPIKLDEPPARPVAPAPPAPERKPTPISLTPTGPEQQTSVWARPKERVAERVEASVVATSEPPPAPGPATGVVPRGFLGGNRPSVLDRLDAPQPGRGTLPEAFQKPTAPPPPPPSAPPPLLDPSEVPTNVGGSGRRTIIRAEQPDRETFNSREIAPEPKGPPTGPAGPSGPENKVFEPNVLSWPFKPTVDFVFDFLAGPNKGCHIDLCQNEMQDDRTYTIGSSGGRINEIVLESGDVANQAATLRYRGGRFGLLNEGPDDSILVNRMPLKRGDQVVLMTGDRIDIADTVFRYLERRVVEFLQTYQVLVESGVDQDQDKHFPFFKQRLLIGRGKNCDIRLNDLEVSRIHIAMVHREGKFFIQHRSETNPTFLNGVSLLPGGERLIQPGDRVRLSSLTLLQFARVEPKKRPAR